MAQLRDDVEYTRKWMAEPEGRGTWGIIYTCVFTLTLCVYSAVHLNIPPAGERELLQRWRRVKLMLTAILAPELVLWIAIGQFHAARTFCREMNNVRLEQEGITTAPEPVKRKGWRGWRRPWRSTKTESPGQGDAGAEEGQDTSSPTSSSARTPFTLTYGFYVVMGGLTIDVRDFYDNVKSVTLTHEGVVHFARLTGNWRLFVVEESTIRDKSKADGLAKFLVILQVTWLLLQCATRAAQGLPLTILEVHSLVHAICALLMYGFWLRKPLDIRDATVVDLSPFPDDLLLRIILMGGSGHPPFTHLYNKTQWTEAGLIRWDNSRLEEALNDSSESGEDARVFHTEPSATSSQEGTLDVVPSDVTLRPDQEDRVKELEAQGIKIKCSLHEGQFLSCGMGPVDSTMHLTEKDMLRWKHAAKSIAQHYQHYRIMNQQHQEFSHLKELADAILPGEGSPACVIARSRSNPGGFGYDGALTLSLLALSLVSAAYAAVHLSLWGYAFPSHAEMMIWKVSACALAVPVAVILAMALLGMGLGTDVFGVGDEIKARVITPTYRMLQLCLPLGVVNVIEEMVDVSLVTVFAAFTVLYAFSRLFVVLESFLSLPLVPAGVYESVQWTEYIPHF